MSEPNPAESHTLSIVIPAHNEAAALPDLIDQIHRIGQSNGLAFELIIVDDGSTDQTWTTIESVSRAQPWVRGIRLLRNFGKEAAIHAGLSQANGAAVLVMDADGQHPPSVIPAMWAKWQSGTVDVVHGIKRSRGSESWLQRFSAWLFYRLLGAISDVDLSRSSDFKLLSHAMVQNYLSLPERQLFFRGLVAWMGGRSEAVAFDVQDRLAGSSSFSTRHLTGLAWLAIRSFSSAPLRIVSWMAGAFLLVALILGGQTLYNKFSGHAVDGFTTVIVLQLFIGFITLLGIGVVGEYLASAFNEVKNRPRYFVGERTRAPDKD